MIQSIADHMQSPSTAGTHRQDTLSRRLEAASAALEQQVALTPEAQQRILLARAQALAQCSPGVAVPSGTLNIVTLSAGTRNLWH